MHMYKNHTKSGEKQASEKLLNAGGKPARMEFLQFLSCLEGASVTSGIRPPAHTSIILGQLSYLGISYVFRSWKRSTTEHVWAGVFEVVELEAFLLASLENNCLWMSRDLNLHVGALKRRAGRFKTLLKQLLLMLHSLQMLSREQVELIGGHGCCPSPASVPSHWDSISWAAPLVTVSSTNSFSVQGSCKLVHFYWKCSEAGIVPVGWAVFTQVYLLFFHVKLFLTSVFGFLPLAIFFLGLSSPSEYLSFSITLFCFFQFNYLLPQFHDKWCNVFLSPNSFL